MYEPTNNSFFILNLLCVIGRFPELATIQAHFHRFSPAGQSSASPFAPKVSSVTKSLKTKTVPAWLDVSIAGGTVIDSVSFAEVACPPTREFPIRYGLTDMSWMSVPAS